jgi:hypothetical protein
MKAVGMILGCGALLAIGSCGEASSHLTCGSGTVEIERACLPAGSGGEADAGGRAGADSTSGGSTGAGSSALGGNSVGGAASESHAGSGGGTESLGGSSGDGGGGDTSGAAGAATGGSEEAGGASGNACTTGPIECAPGVAFQASGSFTASGSSDIIALDDTSVLVGNHVANSLDIFDLCSGAVKKSWPLPAAPDDVAFDAGSRTAYVVLRARPSIAKVMLDGPSVTLINLPTLARVLTTGNHGRVFALLDSNGVSATRLSVIDGTGAVVLNTVNGDFQPLIAYDRAADRLLTASDEGVSAFAFVEATSALTSVDYNYLTGGENCRQLVLSPDQRHVVLACGGGNNVTGPSSPYQILDVDPANLQALYGLYNAGYYPGPAAFSPGSSYFYAPGNGDLLVFSVATHAGLGSYSPGLGLGLVDQLSISPSGRVLVSRSGSDSTSVFNWLLLREASDCK